MFVLLIYCLLHSEKRKKISQEKKLYLKQDKSDKYDQKLDLHEIVSNTTGNISFSKSGSNGEELGT